MGGNQNRGRNACLNGMLKSHILHGLSSLVFIKISFYGNFDIIQVQHSLVSSFYLLLIVFMFQKYLQFICTINRIAILEHIAVLTIINNLFRALAGRYHHSHFCSHCFGYSISEPLTYAWLNEYIIITYMLKDIRLGFHAMEGYILS